MWKQTEYPNMWKLNETYFQSTKTTRNKKEQKQNNHKIHKKNSEKTE